MLNLALKWVHHNCRVVFFFFFIMKSSLQHLPGKSSLSFYEKTPALSKSWILLSRLAGSSKEVREILKSCHEKAKRVVYHQMALGTLFFRRRCSVKRTLTSNFTAFQSAPQSKLCLQWNEMQGECEVKARQQGRTAVVKCSLGYYITEESKRCR